MLSSLKLRSLSLAFSLLTILGILIWLTSKSPVTESTEQLSQASTKIGKAEPPTKSAKTLASVPVTSLQNSTERKVGLGGFPENATWEQANVTASDFSLPYFEKRRKLEILTNRIAVYSSETIPEDTVPALGSLQANGIREQDSEVHAIKGWTIAQTGNALGVNDGPDAVQRIANLVRTISTDAGNPAFSSPVFRDPDLGGLLVATPVVLLGFKEGTPLAERQQALSQVPDVNEAIDSLDIDVSSSFLKIPVKTAKNAFQVFDIVNALATQSSVLFVEPDMIFEGVGQLIPNDPEFPASWGLRNTGQSGGQVDFDMDADLAWDVTLGSANVKVLIIDTGAQQNHPDINQLPGMDFTSESGSNPNGGPVNEFDRHGTPVAGAVSATINNSTGAVGVAPGVKSVSARCFISTNESGSWTGNYSWTANALNWGETQGVRVTNNSNGYGGTSSAIEAAYLSTRNNGAVHFASAGNNGSGTMGYPANVATVYGIAASSRTGGKAGFSQYGPGVAFTAPGASIRLADRTGSAGYSSGDVATMNGTSFSSPYSAGVAALVLSVAPSLTVAQVDNILQTTCVDIGANGYDTTFGYGHINAFAAVTAAHALSDDAYEENDTLQSAYDLSSNVWQWLDSISGQGKQADDDWYQIVSPNGSTRITIECDFQHSTGNVDIVLYNSSGTIVTTSASTTDGEYIDLLVPSSGTYYIRVSGTDSGNLYNLRWRHRPPPFLTIDESESNLPPSSGSGSFSVSSNDTWNWSVSSNSNWLFIIGANPQSGDQDFSFSVLENTLVTPRTEQITLQNGYQTVVHTVNQDGVPPTIDLGDPTETFGPDGGSHDFSVYSNTTWTWAATSGEAYLVSTEASPQTENQTFSYSVSINPEIAPREIVIEFTNGTQTRTHTFTQAGVPPRTISNLTATEQSGNVIDVSWSPGGYATEYQVWRGKAATLNSMTLVTTTAETTFTDTGVESGETYHYRIVSENTNATSDSSSSAAGKLFGTIDAMAQRPGRATLYGDDIFNTLTGQTVTYKTRKKRSSRYRIYLENESDVGSEIVGASSRRGNRKFSIKYISAYASGANVTATMTSGRFLTRSAADNSEVVTVVVKPKGKTRKKRGSISMLARTWLEELPDTTDLVNLRHEKKK